VGDDTYQQTFAAATVPVLPFALTARATSVSFPAFSHLPEYSRSARAHPRAFRERPELEHIDCVAVWSIMKPTPTISEKKAAIGILISAALFTLGAMIFGH
jgi:hypothetical protein